MTDVAPIEYSRVHAEWHDSPALDTPITASALGQIEDGIVAVTDQLNVLLDSLQQQVDQLKMTFRGDWQPTSFMPGDVVKNNGVAYVCTTPVTLPGSIEFVGATNVVIGNGGTQSTLQLPSGTAGGDLVVLAISGAGAASAFGPFTPIGHQTSSFMFTLTALTATLDESSATSGSLIITPVPNGIQTIVARALIFRNATATQFGSASSLVDSSAFTPATAGFAVRIGQSAATGAITGPGLQGTDQALASSGVAMASGVAATTAGTQLSSNYTWTAVNKTDPGDEDACATVLIESSAGVFPASNFAAL